jgi:heptose I phosphotransferase
MAAPSAPAAAQRLGGIVRRLLRGVRRLRERPDWLAHAGSTWADDIMDVSVTDRFHAKQGRSTGRLVLPAPEAGGAPLVVYLKRHYSLPWWQRLLATVWPRGGWSPAMQEWRHLEWARAQGVPVPEALAAAEFIGPAGRLRSFLAVKELTDMLPLNEALPLAAARLDPAAFRRWKSTLASELARLTRLLHDRRCFHKDLYFCHFYIARSDTGGVPADGWRGRVFLIDLHRLAHHPLSWRIWQTKDLAQLLYSSELPGVGARDRLSFWKAYRGPGPRRAVDGWLRSWVLFKWGRYRRHNARRKARVEAARTKQAG